ncbi:MaoC family dehydratase [Kytococcus sp. Marseille-QA3725]
MTSRSTSPTRVPSASSEVELLEAVPHPVALFPRAVRARGRGNPSPEDLPVRRLVVPGAGWSIRELADYSRLCGYPLGGPVPSTWLHVRTFGLQMRLMTADDFPLAVLGLVHLASRWRMHDPVAPDARPRLMVWAQDLVPHAKGAQVTLAASAEVDGRVVWEGWSDYLSRGTTLSGATELSRGTGPAAGVPTPEPSEAAALPERARWRLGADAGRRYAAVSGDANPIHLSAPTARLFGFPRAIAHGMFTAARTVAWLGPQVPAAHEIDVRFAKPLLLPAAAVLRSDRSRGVSRVAVTSRDASRVHMTGSVRPLGH